MAGIVLDAATTRLAVADLAGETLAATEAETPLDEGPERLLSWMSGEIRALLSAAGVAQGRGLLAVTAGLPGAVDRERGTVVGLMPGFRNWENLCRGGVPREGWSKPRWSWRTTSSWPFSASTGGVPPRVTTPASSSPWEWASARASSSGASSTAAITRWRARSRSCAWRPST